MAKVKYKGGSFLLNSPELEDVFIPEEFTEEQRMIADTTRNFVENEVRPVIGELEEHHFEHSVRLLRRAGELGLLGVEIPEEYGGMGLDKITATIVGENMGPAGAFAITFGAHTGIGTLPIVYFGNKEQKGRYLPALASGEKVSAYALTEPSSGSDALSIRTTATLSPDGRHYILSGTKQFITNAGIADIFVTYAKVDGDKFSAFIIEKDFPGVSLGREERKMGIRGSSTRQIILDEAQVPVENLLGEMGRGHYIAFNILNIGRWKLGAGALGSTKYVLRLAVQYAKVRTQFGKFLSEFPLIQDKLAEMNTRIYAAESMIYRMAGLMEEAVSQIDYDSPDYFQQAAKSISEYAIESSISKVFGTEVLDFVVDEGVQIHGGYGYTEEYEVERAYRDSRINRIFEGTNEINRLLIPGTLLRRALKGELPLMSALGRLQDELMSLSPPTFSGAPLEQESYMLDMARKIFLMAGGLAVQKYQQKIEGEEETLAALADIAIEIMAMESAILRARKAIKLYGLDACTNKIDMATLYAHQAMARIENIAKVILSSLEEGDSLRTQLSILKRLTRYEPVNQVALKRRIAQRVIQAEKYQA